MTLLGAPWSILGPAFAVAGAALISLYVLKLRRRRVEVPFADLWRRVLKDTESTALWKRLKRLLSLALQLLLLLLLLFAIGDPHLSASQRGRTLALCIDTSASMQSTDGTGAGNTTRLDEAKDVARKLVRSLGGADLAMIVAVDGRPAPATGLTSDERALLAAIDKLTATDTPADLERALRLSADALRGRPLPTLVLIGDGAYDDAVWKRVALQKPPGKDQLGAIDLSGVDLRFAPVGKSGDNVALTAFAVRRYRANQTAYEVLAEVQSFRAHPSSVKLELVQDGEVVEVERLDLKPGERVQRLFPNLAGEGTRLEAHLRPADAKGDSDPRLDVLPLDDRAYALLPPRKKVKVLLVSAGNLFLEGALLLDENLEVEKVAPAGYDAQKAARFDAVVLDSFVPPTPPTTHALYIDPRGADSPFPLRGELASPIVTEVAADHPIMRWVTLRDLNISRASRFALQPGDVAVASALREPIIVARDRGGHKQVALGFDLRRSDLPMRVAFPILVVNALDWFAGADTGLMASYPTGQTWRLLAPPGAPEVQVRGPDGRLARAPVHDGRATYYGLRAGYYDVKAEGAPTRLVAANLSSVQESRVEPKRELTVDGKKLAAPDAGRLGVKRSLWSYLVILALLLTMVEWWTYNRRVTI